MVSHIFLASLKVTISWRVVQVLSNKNLCIVAAISDVNFGNTTFGFVDIPTSLEMDYFDNLLFKIAKLNSPKVKK